MAFEDRIHGFAANYVAAPQWVKSILGTTYAMLPNRVRLGRAYEHYLRVFEAPSPSPDYSRLCLSQTLAHALSTVPAYREYQYLAKDLATDPLGVLAQIPLTSKEAIKQRTVDYLSTQVGAKRLRMFTGGSTSIPMTLFLTQGVSRAKEWAAFHALATRYNTDGLGIVLALRGRTVGTAELEGGRLWSYEPIKRQLIMSSDHLESRYMTNYVAALQRWRPQHVHAFPSALYPLVRWLFENGHHDLLAQVKGVLLTSESVFPYQLELFKKFFRCPVIVHYGHTERVLFAHTLPNDPRYFFWPHYGHFELVDTNGSPITTPGQMGEIVGTSFDNQVMPFIRYRTGDYAVLSGQHAPAGMEEFPVCERIEGRLQEFVVCRDKRLISVTTLGAAHFEQLDQCARIQYEQRVEGELLLRLVPLTTGSAINARQIADAVIAKTQGGCSVVIEVVNDIPLTPRGKQRLLLQHLDISHYLGASIEDINPVKVNPATKPTKMFGTLGQDTGKSILMVGTDPHMRGGIASVVSIYKAAGLFNGGLIKYLPSHVDTRTWKKLGVFVAALSGVLSGLMGGRVLGVHAHVSSKGSFWRKSIILWMARSFGVKTLFHLHSGGFDRFVEKRTRLEQWWIRHTLQTSDSVIVLSKQWEHWVTGFAPMTKTFVLGNPVIIPQTVNKSPRQKQVIFLGLICDAKGCFDLLKAFERIKTSFPDWHLVVGGNGEVARFHREVETAGLTSQVEFRGWVDSAERSRLLNSAAIYCLPSYAEGLPMGMLEAMAYGLPVVVTPVGGISDTVTNESNGLTVPPGDISSLVNALERLMSSANLRAAIGEAGRITASQFSSDQVLLQLASIYKKVGFLK